MMALKRSRLMEQALPNQAIIMVNRPRKDNSYYERSSAACLSLARWATNLADARDHQLAQATCPRHLLALPYRRIGAGARARAIPNGALPERRLGVSALRSSCRCYGGGAYL